MEWGKKIQQLRSLLSERMFNVVILTILGLITYGLLMDSIKPDTYDVQPFSIADRTITAPKTVLDPVKTEDERERAADSINDVYVFKDEVVNNQTALLSSVFDLFIEAQKQTKIVKEEVSSNASNTDSSTETSTVDRKVSLTIEEQVTYIKAQLSDNREKTIINELTDREIQLLLELSLSQIEGIKENIVSDVREILNSRVRETTLTDAKQQAAYRVTEYDFPQDVIRVLQLMIRASITPSELFDEEETELRKSDAKESVEPARILQGQVIVQKGYIIDREVYRQLELLGVLKNNPTIFPYLGLGVFVLLVVVFMHVFLKRSEEDVDIKQAHLIMASIIFIFSLLLMKGIRLVTELEIPNLSYMYPAALAPMLIRLLINERVAIVQAVLLSACGSILFQQSVGGLLDLEFALYSLFSGLAGVLFLSANSARSNILQTGFVVSVVNMLVILSTIMIGDGTYSQIEYVYFTIFSLVSGLLAAVLTLGLLPFFEAGFGILSPMKLIELSNPNHPLLKKILVEAPGTYHHSVMVANLAEAACEAVGANGLLARVGCYYHDIGKTKRPKFFIENQMSGPNPHDRLRPSTSRDIIIAHATDGAEMLRKAKMPKEIIDIAEQHHGTTLLKFFYFKEKKENEDVSEQSYRYPGPKAQSKEAAIIGVADSVEAAVRSMDHPTSEQIKKVIDSIVQDRLNDGQFNECDLTLSQLETIKKTFSETLNGIFHSRIEYPEDEKKEKEND
ncbi:HD family phosphohydrolase [Mangrovibacillus cuniculi]|uniref:HD family phosphohydrolase n=1 Tax=Mangrovibacillus cuniculi TaxID=2593652 RepID=A0A7S8CBH4_9BACI|nr:HD family phosphohydrolase [Mangrovibacillus cuniculi]QPC46923.1 HD family phosphohydrolase [Mangrovibacillus cuniculi]